MKKLALVGAVLVGGLLLAPSSAEAQCGYPYGPCGVVYVAPQPVYVAAPAPTVVVAQPAPVAVEAPAPFVRSAGFGLGLRATAGYAGEHGLGLYGGGLVLRYIATPHFGLELDVDGYGAGTDGDDAFVVPISLSALVFLNAQSHVQPYLIGGLDLMILGGEGCDDASYLYAGGHAGVGIEFLLGSHVGLTLDARTFVQGMVDADEIEYGVTFNTGFNVYL